ncbi:hypothetical protein L484_001592 [Morus notabilis]|uniref:Uncharacterized protein n=1 Tax=Morus notabilis TaxID=981085 RepID=W9RID8_9ROSA|nr:hypothetical protein L484_001592 [Morus notabilis]
MRKANHKAKQNPDSPRSTLPIEEHHPLAKQGKNKKKTKEKQITTQCRKAGDRQEAARPTLGPIKRRLSSSFLSGETLAT